MRHDMTPSAKIMTIWKYGSLSPIRNMRSWNAVGMVGNECGFGITQVSVRLPGDIFPFETESETQTISWYFHTLAKIRYSRRLFDESACVLPATSPTDHHHLHWHRQLQVYLHKAVTGYFSPLTLQHGLKEGLTTPLSTFFFGLNREQPATRYIWYIMTRYILIHPDISYVYKIINICIIVCMCQWIISSSLSSSSSFDLYIWSVELGCATASKAFCGSWFMVRVTSRLG